MMANEAQLIRKRKTKKVQYSRETIHRKMAAVKSKGTVPELLLGKAMWKLGLRYRKHYKIPGTPDFVFVKAKIAVFCDGDFWHGNGWRIRGFKNRKEEQKTYNKFWRNKVIANIARDKMVNKRLRNQGWVVIRFWESSIKKTPQACAIKVMRAYKM
jgi:DNA mismatch endonuclease, patch repair protein